MSQPFLPQRIVITSYPKSPDVYAEANAIVDYLQKRGIEAFMGALYDETLRKRVKSGEFDLMIAVGGDGTMLRAGHLCAPVSVPILGINLGRLGFLIQINRSQWEQALDSLFIGEAWLEERIMLHAEHYRNDQHLGTWQALNEIAVCRDQQVRPVHLSATVDEGLMTTYVADGLIAATPTGSTAYALAAGGPILPPELRNILMVPIAPHLSIDRAIVLAIGSEISISVQSDNAVLSVDGQIPVDLNEDDCVKVRTSGNIAQFVRFGDRDYFYRNITAHMNQNPSFGVPR